MKNAAEDARLNSLRDQHFEQERLDRRLRDKIEGRRQKEFAVGVAIFTLLMCLLYGIVKALSLGPTVSQAPPPPNAQTSATVAPLLDKRERARLATGNADGGANWSALDSATYPTVCGITPTDRFYITQNSIGRTVHDEPTEDEWVQAGCERTSPIHQAAILQQAESMRQQRAAADANRKAAEIGELNAATQRSKEENEAAAERKRTDLQKFESCWDTSDGANDPHGMTQEQIDAAKAKCGSPPGVAQ